MASQRKTSLSQYSMSFGCCVAAWTVNSIPIGNVDDVIPLLLDTLVQEFFKPIGPCPTESRPHLFGFNVQMTTFPVVLNRAGKSRIECMANVRVCICHIVILRA